MTDTCPDCQRPVGTDFDQPDACHFGPGGDKCQKLAIANLRARIAELEAAREVAGAWVAAVERMPGHAATVFFVVDGHVASGDFDASCGGYWNEAGGCWPAARASHWMPRYVPPEPAPPITEAEPVMGGQESAK